MKFIFKMLVRMHVFFYRLTGGKFGGNIRGFPVLLLTTTGRKTGRPHTTALGYFEDSGAYVIIGSNAGFDTHPAWFYNLKAQPRATIEINARRLEVVAETAGPDQRARLWARLIELAPPYGEYEKRTRREIPLVMLRPVAQ